MPAHSCRPRRFSVGGSVVIRSAGCVFPHGFCCNSSVSCQRWRERNFISLRKIHPSNLPAETHIGTSSSYTSSVLLLSLPLCFLFPLTVTFPSYFVFSPFLLFLLRFLFQFIFYFLCFPWSPFFDIFFCFFFHSRNYTDCISQHWQRWNTICITVFDLMLDTSSSSSPPWRNETNIL